MVSLSGARVIRRKRDLLLHLRLHQFHRPSDGTSGELGFMRPRSSFSSILCELSQDVKGYLFDLRQTNNDLFHMSQIRAAHICAFLAMVSRPLGRASCQSPKPEGSAEGAGIDSECACQANRLAMKRLHVSRSGMRSGPLLVAPAKACSINPHAMENHGNLASHRNLGALHAPPLGNSQTPSLEC